MQKGLFGFFCLLFTSLFALDFPEPIEKKPEIKSESYSTFHIGRTIFSFLTPPSWGISPTSSVSTERGNFTIVSSEDEIDCSFQVNQFPDKAKANEEIERLKQTFTETTLLENGFEALSDDVWYACYTQERYVVQIWYFPPKKSEEGLTVWEKIKKCPCISEDKEKIIDTPHGPLKEIPWEGFVCTHPDNNLHVLFKKNIFYASKPNTDPNTTYLLQIGDMGSNGFFYIKWDQQELNTQTPYQTHLDEIKADILKINKEQKFEKNTFFNAEEGWALLRGNPYTLFSISGENFLVGFALRNNHKFRSFDINDYIERVEWWED